MVIHCSRSLFLDSRFCFMVFMFPCWIVSELVRKVIYWEHPRRHPLELYPGHMIPPARPYGLQASFGLVMMMMRMIWFDDDNHDRHSKTRLTQSWRSSKRCSREVCQPQWVLLIMTRTGETALRLVTQNECKSTMLKTIIVIIMFKLCSWS